MHLVAGILRNLGHKKKERTRQESTLLYTPGALTWKVSIVFRNGKVCLICVHANTARFNGCTRISHPHNDVKNWLLYCEIRVSLS